MFCQETWHWFWRLPAVLPQKLDPIAPGALYNLINRARSWQEQSRFSHEHGKKHTSHTRLVIKFIDTDIGHDRLRLVPLETLTDVLTERGRLCKPA